MSNVIRANKMFQGATSFNQNLCSWSSDINNIHHKYGMFQDSGCPDASINYGTPSDTSVCHSGCSGW